MIKNYSALIANSKYCPFCGGHRLRFFEEKDSTGPNILSIVECKVCLVAWQLPKKTSRRDSLSFFNKQYSDSEKGVSEYFNEEQRKKTAALEMSFVRSLRSGPGSLLDVGAGMGFFVSEAIANGWQAIGVEPAAEGVAKAKSLGNDAILNCALSGLTDGRKFDIVTLWDVIEHVNDPLSFLEEASRRVQENGYLIIECINYQSADVIEYLENHWIWQLDHMWYLTPPVLETLLRQIGFNKFVYADRVFRADYKAGGKRKPSLLGFVKKVIRRPHKLIAEIGIYCRLMNSYNRLYQWIDKPIFVVAAQKSSEKRNV
jgi:2-polyprenyl-3-methyl-5-hydroxy-6-metoxy-1,4-benzoquinol methylase